MVIKIIETTENYTEYNYPFQVLLNGEEYENYGCLSRAIKQIWEDFGIRPEEFQLNWEEDNLQLIALRLKSKNNTKG